MTHIGRASPSICRLQKAQVQGLCELLASKNLGESDERCYQLASHSFLLELWWLCIGPSERTCGEYKTEFKWNPAFSTHISFADDRKSLLWHEYWVNINISTSEHLEPTDKSQQHQWLKKYDCWELLIATAYSTTNLSKHPTYFQTTPHLFATLFLMKTKGFCKTCKHFPNTPHTHPHTLQTTGRWKVLWHKSVTLLIWTNTWDRV